MLSIGRIGAGMGYQYLMGQVAKQDASAPGQRMLSYYEATGYPAGTWWGTGAQRMELSGAVTELQMSRLFGDGFHPVTGTQLGRSFAVYASVEGRIMARLATLDHSASDEERDTIAAEVEAAGQRQAVAGFDLTFSAPKSVSVLWGLADDHTRNHVAEAHRAAWHAAMTDFESEVATTRLGKDGVAQVDVNGITAAGFEHFYSREGDPQLHTHVAVSSLVETLDGRWRRLDSRAMYRAAAAIGERYTGYLVHELEDRVGVRWRYREGTRPGVRLPELDGIDDNLIRAFSCRRASIEGALAERVGRYRAEHGRSPDRKTLAMLSQEVTLAGRPDPAQRTFFEQQREWRTTAAEMSGVVAEEQAAWLGSITGRQQVGRQVAEDDLSVLVTSTIVRIMDTEGTWTTRDLQRHGAVALREAGIRTDAPTVARLVSAVTGRPDVYSIEAPELVPPPERLRRSNGISVFERAGEARWTHRAVLDAEESLRMAVAEPGPALEGEELLAHLQGLGADQREAVTHLATSGRLLDAAIGPAGSGKTTAMVALVAAWLERGDAVHILAPTAVAAAELGDAVGVPGETLDRALWQWRQGRNLPSAGSLILIDEASMATSLRLAEAVQIARQHGAALRLLGDPCQLAAVGAGGGLEIVADAAGAPELGKLHRFVAAWEGPATLALRHGDEGVLGVYEEHDRIRSGITADVEDQAYVAWKAAIESGKEAIMVASDNATVAALAARARADRVAVGKVEPGGVRLADDSEAGVGDIVVTRRNDRRLAMQGPGSRQAFVRNHDRWLVTARTEDGSLVVTHLRCGATAQLPAEYVAKHVQLSYAHTVHGAQGVTVDVGLAIVKASDQRRALYVAMTRGRYENVAHVVTDELEEEPHGFHPDHNARQVLAQVLANDGPLAATTQIARSYEQAERLDTLADRFDYARRADLEGRLAEVASEIGVEDLVGTPGWVDVLDAADVVEAAGIDAGLTLRAVDATDADSMVSQLYRAQHTARLAPQLQAGLVGAPGPGASPETVEYLDRVSEAMKNRVNSLADQLASGDLPVWAAALGTPPEDPARRLEWSRSAATVAAWREREGITDPRPLGPVPACRLPALARMSRRSAAAAYDRGRELAGLGVDEVPSGLQTAPSPRPKPRMGPGLRL